MRIHLTITLLVTVFFSVLASNSSAQRVTLSARQLPVLDVLAMITEQTGYNFAMEQRLNAAQTSVTLNLKDAPIAEALKKVFVGKSISFEIHDRDRVVIIRESVTPEQALSRYPVLIPVVEEIRGRVVDSLGRPMAGVSIRVIDVVGRRTRLQTKTDDAGYFDLQNVPEDASLEVTHVGYRASTIRVAEMQESTVVVLFESDHLLDETIVQGYGTTSRRLNTGNIARISAAELEKQPLANPLGALQGRIPGMLVTQTTGLPGGAFNIQIRGRTAIDEYITSDNPLFVIDGVPFGEGSLAINGLPSANLSQIQSALKSGISPFNGVNIQDIESIEVLKDADATAIYGSRGANGVILITTKRSSTGTSQLTVNSYQGVSYLGDPVQMMNTEQYLEMRRQAFANDGVTMTEFNAPDVLLWDPERDYDYANLFTGNTAGVHNTQLGYSGGSGLTRFALRGGYHWENTVLDKDHKNERINVAFNVTQRSNDDRFNLLFAGNYAHTVTNIINTDLAQFMMLPPHLRLYDDEGELSWEYEGFQFENPLAERLRNNNSTTTTLYGNIQPSYKLTEGLRLLANIGYNMTNTEQLSYRPITSINPSYHGNPWNGSRQVQLGGLQNRFFSFEPQLDFQRTLGPGRLHVLFGGTYQASHSAYRRTDAREFASDDAMRSLANAPTITMRDGATEYRYVAGFGRVNYNIQDTYLLNLTARRDGSSRFGPNRRFATFGAAGAAWIFSNESGFSEALPWMSFGKLRASYGITGNDKVTDYQYLETWSVNTAFLKPELGDEFLYPDKLFNPDYRWESTRKAEIALEFGFFNDRILFSPVWFSNRSSNQLVNYRLPLTTGFFVVVSNLPATVDNYGLEFSLSSENIRKPNFQWRTDVNLSVPRNKLVAFPDLEKSSYASSYVVGQPLNVLYKLNYTGVDPETGVYTFDDLNEDGRYDQADYVASGTTDPKFYGGIQNTFTFGNVNFSFHFMFRKTLGVNYMRHFQGAMHNLPVVDAKVWEKPGDIADIAKYSSQGRNNQFDFSNYSNGVYSDASFIRLNNVALSYTIPGRLIGGNTIKGLRIYALANNLMTFTAYEAGDPEVQTFLTTPPLRTITGGVQLTF